PHAGSVRVGAPYCECPHLDRPGGGGRRPVRRPRRVSDRTARYATAPARYAPHHGGPAGRRAARVRVAVPAGPVGMAGVDGDCSRSGSGGAADLGGVARLAGRRHGAEPAGLAGGPAGARRGGSPSPPRGGRGPGAPTVGRHRGGRAAGRPVDFGRDAGPAGTAGGVMIELDGVGVTYPGQDPSRPALRDVTFAVDEGELVLVVGPTGGGKSTLLRCVNGLVPHFSGGALTGTVSVDGRDTRTHRPRDLADVVGLVGQDPLASFVTDTVEDELAYGMETLGVDPSAMRRRVEETLDLLGLAEVRDRTLAELSGGQQQRVAIGAVLTAGPRTLVPPRPPPP